MQWLYASLTTFIVVYHSVYLFHLTSSMVHQAMPLPRCHGRVQRPPARWLMGRENDLQVKTMKHISKAVAGSHYSEAVINRGQRPRPTTLAKISAWMAVPCLILLLSACSASKHIQSIPVETVLHDTLYVNKQSYDSIYIDNSHLIDRGSDTVYIKDKSIEYRYRLLRDTIRIAKCDSIPYEVRIETIKEVKYIPPWIQYLAWAGGLPILLLIIRLTSKNKRLR